MIASDPFSAYYAPLLIHTYDVVDRIVLNAYFKLDGASALSKRGDARNDLRFAARSGAWQLDAGDRHIADPLIPHRQDSFMKWLCSGALGNRIVNWEGYFRARV